jgi:hypothetical protein
MHEPTISPSASCVLRGVCSFGTMSLVQYVCMRGRPWTVAGRMLTMSMPIHDLNSGKMRP